MSSIGKDQLYIVSKLPQFCRLREFLFISFFSILNTYYFSQTFCHFDWAQRLRILDSFCVFSMRRFASYSKWRFSCQFEFIYVSRWPPALPRRSRGISGIENRNMMHLDSQKTLTRCDVFLVSSSDQRESRTQRSISSRCVASLLTRSDDLVSSSLSTLVDDHR